ncbi:hypothetical protein CEUSTIGMA_g2624.t1 [Chlamydomonas eustigma]|uniref:Uncharacterized protein n=1 Tax=Chlamydomonas eustigma TaxID=1157962 RepID=A0A250WXC5_9CHLO|nr:hypothetical protein CEUSTIGMA_g2624.t1 [Chlamydomonas eustigma]|eukprot:GAX75180.1 hypothetical protein CEUSTIGMA_g2624.t1 [Chlamydomonas eustigma]
MSAEPSVETRHLSAGSEVTNILGTSCAGKPVAGSFIKHWEKHSGCSRSKCAAQGCLNEAKEGGHVKIAGGPLSSLMKADWWIIPVCKTHNKGLSCKSYKVDSVIAVEAPPKFNERVRSWKHDFEKLGQYLKEKMSKLSI